MKISKIGWCDFSGKDLNFVVRGFTLGDCECGPGCANCYVKALDNRFHFLPERTTVYPDKLARLANKRFPQLSPKRGEPYKPMCFLVDTGDLFHESVPDLFLMHVFDILRSRPDVIWQILTKRPRRMRKIVTRYCKDRANIARLRDSIWLGVSVSNQRTADERIPILLGTEAMVRFVSIEPCLSAIDLRHIDDLHIDKQYGDIHYCIDALSGDVTWGEMRDTGAVEPMGEPGNKLDWVIVGAESGPNRRPFDVAWAADILHQCQEAGVACFLKQDSALYPGKPLIVDGKEWKEWPKI